MISAQTARRAVWRPLWELPRRLDLILSLTRRELAARYKGSALGIIWAVLTPIVMIAIFTIIFAGIFKAKFAASDSQWDYALYLFCGLLPWNAFQESLSLSSNAVVNRANLVKRVVFPLETLPVAQTLAAIANAFVRPGFLVAERGSENEPARTRTIDVSTDSCAAAIVFWDNCSLGTTARDSPATSKARAVKGRESSTGMSLSG